MSIKVSIIVPVHNTEKYLSECLESLVNQSLEEIEIILVNDCSTDNSLEVLQKYKKKYPKKIIVINLEQRRGPGGARNAGIQIAKGEYIGFVDSDDYVETAMFEELYRIAELNDSDLVDCGFYFEALDKNLRTTSDGALGKLNLQKRKELFIHSGFVWSKIVKSNIIINNNVKFRENVACEDIDFIRIALFYCNSVDASDLVLYNHRNNDASISNQLNKDIDIIHKMECMRSLVSKFDELNVYSDYKEEIAYLVYKTYIVMIDYVLMTESEDLKVQSLKKLRNFFFELIDYDYHDNEYILRFAEEDRELAELNNRDCNELI